MWRREMEVLEVRIEELERGLRHERVVRRMERDR